MPQSENPPHLNPADGKTNGNAEGNIRDANASMTDRWRSTIEATGIGTYETNHLLNTFDASPQFLAILGLNPGELQGLNTLVAKTHPDDFTQFTTATEKSLDPLGTGAFDLEHRVIHPDQSLHWVWTRGQTEFAVDPLTGERRAVVSRGVMIDITDQKMAEAAINEGRERLNMALNASRMVVWETDRERNTVFVSRNQKYKIEEEAFGTIDLARGRIHPDDAGAMRAAAESAIREQRDFSQHIRIRRIDGPEYDWFEIRGRVQLREGLAPRLYGVAVDITESKHSHELLKRNEQLLRLGTEIAGVIIVEVNYLTGEVRLPREASELFGFGDVEMVMQRERIRMLYHPDDRADILRRLTQSLAPNSTGEMGMEARIIRPDGQVRWLAMRQQVFFETSADGTKFPSWGLYALRDITERKNREVALSESQQRLALAVAAAKLVVWEWNIDNQTFVSSENCTDILGTMLNSDDMGISHIHPEDRGALQAAVQSALDSGQDFCHQARLVRPDNGKVLWLEIRGRLHEDSGQGRRLLGVSVDITESKKAIDLLKRNEERLRIGTDVAGVAIGEVDYRTGLIHLPGKAAAIIGLPAKDMIVTRDQMREFYHSDDRQAILEKMAHCLDPYGDGLYEMESRIVRTNREVRWIAVRQQVFFEIDSEGVRVPARGLYAVRDITERKQAEAELAITTERLKTAIKSSRLTVFNQDLDLRYTWVHNPVAGFKLEEMIGKTDYDIFADRTVAEQRVAMKRGVIQSGVGIRSEANYTLRGENFWFDMFIDPLRDLAGNIVGVTGAALNITERKVAEKELQEAARHKDEFLAMLAHELRNPLAGVSNALEILHLEEAGQADLEWAYSSASRQMQNLTRLTDDLLDVSRISHGKIQLKLERVNLATIVLRAIENVRPSIDSRTQILQVALPAAPLFVDADPTRAEQIFVNILVNATKYTNPEGNIDVSLFVERGQAVFRVKDSGIGIPPEKVDGIFELFSQIDTSLDRARGGLGIGLAVVQGLAKMHGWKVEAFSEGLGKGSEFSVRLPLPGLTQRNRASGPRLSQEQTDGTLKILAVEDSPDILRGLKLLLTHIGHSVVTATEATVALAAARAMPFDVAILDIGLPGMDGYELARKLREHALTPQMLLIACSGYGREEDRESSLLAGFDHHLVKPVDYKTLTNLLMALQKAK